MVYDGGVAFTPQMGETLAIVQAKGATGAAVTNGFGLRVDSRGHAIVSNLSPFARSTVELSPRGLPMNVQLKSTEEQTVPTAGAVTLVRFDVANNGTAAILRSTLDNGEPLPFGADVLDPLGLSVGAVAQSGRILAHSLPAADGELIVRWGSGANESCLLSYSLQESGEAPANSQCVLIAQPASVGSGFTAAMANGDENK